MRVDAYSSPEEKGSAEITSIVAFVLTRQFVNQKSKIVPFYLITTRLPSYSQRILQKIEVPPVVAAADEDAQRGRVVRRSS
jgi:hypothetical protein